jgi:hypothetical protein
MTKTFTLSKTPELFPLEGKRTDTPQIGKAGHNARQDFRIACVGVLFNIIFPETSRGRPERLEGRGTITLSAKPGRVSQRLRELPINVTFLEFVRSLRHRLALFRDVVAVGHTQGISEKFPERLYSTALTFHPSGEFELSSQSEGAAIRPTCIP